MNIRLIQTYQAILKQAEDYFRQHANPELVAKYSRYFKEGYDAYGIADEELDTLVKQVEAAHPDFPLGQILELGLLLFQTGKYEAGSLAIRLLNRKKVEFDHQTITGLKDWFDRGVTNWGHSDYLSTITIPWLYDKALAFPSDMLVWLTSGSRWTRRAVPVSFISLKKSTAPQELFAVTESLMLDPERVVHQGMGWFLREIWKLHPKPVEDLLFQYHNTAARLLIQYATEKMTPAQKARFRKDK